MSTAPTGPWNVASSVPKEIYTIPPSSPVYNVTCVTQTQTSPTTVESDHTAGYLGMFLIGTAVGLTIAYGTGYYYPPYYYHPPYGYPIYRPYPATYGVGAFYSPYSGTYGVARGAYGPYGGVTGAAWYNPSTGRYGRLSRHTVHMAVRPRRVPTTLITVCTGRRVRVRTLTATGEVPSPYGATNGEKERAAPVIAEQMEIAASSHRARTTICTPARMGTSTARTRAAVGKSMTMVAGRIQVQNQLPMPRMRH
jgi:hypothetical protein